MACFTRLENFEGTRKTGKLETRKVANVYRSRSTLKQVILLYDGSGNGKPVASNIVWQVAPVPLSEKLALAQPFMLSEALMLCLKRYIYP